MTIIIEHFFIFLQIALLCLFLSISGFLLKKLVFNEKDNENFEENGIFGFILVGFISLSINFFYPLNLLINNVFFILIFFLAIKKNFFRQNILKLLKRIICVSIVCYIIFIYSNVNTPDALLYHLPYSKIINEHKIILGLSNIHNRFGHISIFQYISSFFNNSIMRENGLLIPIGLLASFFFNYLYRLFRYDFKDESLRIKSYFTFLILIFSFYSFNRYSGYGNDAQGHIYYFLVILYLFDFFIKKKSLLTFKKLSLVCFFTFLAKPFYLITFLIPLIIFFTIRKDFIIIKSKFFIFTSFFCIFWLLKNFLITGCFVYPMQKTCIKSALWLDKDIENVSISGEAWAKSWPQNLDKTLNQDQFNKDFNWVSTWSRTHLFVIFEKLLPVSIFLIINFLFFYFTHCLKKNYQNINQNNKFYFIFFLINFLFITLWFLKFPIYRFGISIIYTFIIFSCYFIFIKNINFKKLKKYYNFFNFFIVIIFSLILIKNINRITNDKFQSISPSLYAPNDNGKYLKVLNKNNVFTHYHKDIACGYSPSPCSNIKINLMKKVFYGYLIYYSHQ